MNVYKKLLLLAANEQAQKEEIDALTNDECERVFVDARNRIDSSERMLRSWGIDYSDQLRLQMIWRDGLLVLEQDDEIHENIVKISTLDYVSKQLMWLLNRADVFENPDGDGFVVKGQFELNPYAVERYIESLLVDDYGNQYDSNFYFVCEHCGGIYSTEYAGTVYDLANDCEMLYCDDCRRYHAEYCADCGRYFDGESRETWDGSTVCNDCYEDAYYTCEDCGRAVNANDVQEYDGCFYCPDCIDRVRPRIRSYHDTPDVIYNTTEGERTNKYIGCEIETERGDVFKRFEITERRGDDEECIYQMHDGSLDSDGIELITQPMSKMFFDRFDFEGWFRELSEAGARSHDTEHCGLHVHLSRSWFGSGAEQQEETAATVSIIMDTFIRQLKTLARRTDEHWCKFPSNPAYAGDYKDACQKEKGHKKYLKKVKEKLVGRDRYRCLNTATSTGTTYEFRIFRGTLNPKTFRASVALCIRLVEYAKYKNRNNSRLYSWEQFKNFKRMPQVLADYINSKKL